MTRHDEQQHWRSKLTEGQRREILRRLRQSERGLDLAREYGVSPTTISKIATGARRVILD